MKRTHLKSQKLNNMKYYVVLGLIIFSMGQINAQVPQKISFQAVLRNQSNAFLSSKKVGIKISVFQGDTLSSPVYSEYQNVNTNINGLVSLQIGTGTNMNGNFSKIDWSSGKYYVKTETDPNGGYDFKIIGSSELLSVPYAFYALNTQNENGKMVTTNQLNGVDPFNINLKGNLGSSGNVTVAGNIEALGSTSTLGTNLKPFKGLFISSGSLSIASDILGQNVPAAVLSNVDGNLQISAGGLKLMGDSVSFIAPNIISTLKGNASTSTKLLVPKNINGIPFDGSSDITISSEAGTLHGINLASNVTGSNLTSVGALNSGEIPYRLLTGSVPIWNQSTSGNAATVSTNANLQGVVTSTGNSTSIAQGAISNQMLANSAVSNLSGTNSGDQTNISGNAATATKLASSKTINGVAFDGSLDISISVDAGALRGINLASNVTGSKLTSVGVLNSGEIPYRLLTGTVPIWNQSTSGNAATVSTNANLFGVISSVGNSTSIANGAISNMMLENSAVANLSGINTGNQTSISGNAGTSTKFIDSKNINGVAFDGSSDITIQANILNIGTQDGNERPSVKLDLSKQVFVFNDGTWILPNGQEGQICHFVMGEKGSAEDIYIIVENIRFINRSIADTRSNISWSPFHFGSETDFMPSMATAIFTQGAWNVTSGTLR
jgi:hypothetical protein